MSWAHDGEDMEGLEDDLDTTNVDHGDLLGPEQAESKDIDDEAYDDCDDAQLDKNGLALEEEEDLPMYPIRQKRLQATRA